jgi:rsbT antagonist protein RsbS
LVELGLELKGVHTALNVEKGMELLKKIIKDLDTGEQDEEEVEEIETNEDSTE